MKICFVINDVATERIGSTMFMVSEAFKRGHQVFLTTVGDFSFINNSLSIHCKHLPKNAKPENAKEFLEILQSDKIKNKKLSAQDLDVLFIRNNPTEEESGRQWAENAGVAFGRMMQQEGVLVLNDAYALSHAFIDKLYFEELPEEIKPASIITRDKEEILDFFEKHKKKIVLKPLEGSGGQNVYLIDKNEKNINQIITTISEKGYVIAQEYLPAVKDGDVRVLLMNGEVLKKDGKYGVVKRVSGEGEFRSNLSLGASPDSSPFTDEMKRIIELTAPKLKKDGLFLVGLDIVKDKLIEINVLSPGGLEVMMDIGLPDFSPTIIEAIEKKVEYKKIFKGQISNKVLATMA